jgi:hypothetical protein
VSHRGYQPSARRSAAIVAVPATIVPRMPRRQKKYAPPASAP